MISILKFNQFKVNELKEENKLISVGTTLNLRLTDKDGVHNIKCKLTDYGYVGRDPAHYSFIILESDSKKYNIGGDFYLGFEFDGIRNRFLFHPNLDDHQGYVEKHYKALIETI